MESINQSSQSPQRVPRASPPSIFDDVQTPVERLKETRPNRIPTSDYDYIEDDDDLEEVKEYQGPDQLDLINEYRENLPEAEHYGAEELSPWNHGHANFLLNDDLRDAMNADPDELPSTDEQNMRAFIQAGSLDIFVPSLNPADGNANESEVDYLTQFQQQNGESMFDGARKGGLTKHDFRKFKLVRIIKTKKQNTCSICHEQVGEGDRTYKLPCDHVFHHGCIKPWLKTSTQCPNCRVDLQLAIQFPQLLKKPEPVVAKPKKIEKKDVIEKPKKKKSKKDKAQEQEPKSPLKSPKKKK